MGLLLAASACGRPGCDGKAYEANPLAPVVTRMNIVDTFPQDPWTLVLGIEFTGGSSTLSQGSALFYLGGDTTPTRVPLAQAFAQSAVPSEAKSGRLGVLFPFNGGIVQDGDIIRLGVQLEDGNKPDPNGTRSNCYNLDLSFDVFAARQQGTAAWRQGLGQVKQLATRLFDAVRRWA